MDKNIYNNVEIMKMADNLKKKFLKPHQSPWEIGKKIYMQNSQILFPCFCFKTDNSKYKRYPEKEQNEISKGISL